MTLNLSGKSQIILYVRDMGKEVWFYRDILGLVIRYPQGLENYAGEMWVEFSLGDHSLALHGNAKPEPDKKHEVVFWVDDVSNARKIISKAGIEIGEVRILEDGASIAEGFDPDGHRFAIRA